MGTEYLHGWQQFPSTHTFCGPSSTSIQMQAMRNSSIKSENTISTPMNTNSSTLGDISPRTPPPSNETSEYEKDEFIQRPFNIPSSIRHDESWIYEYQMNSEGDLNSFHSTKSPEDLEPPFQLQEQLTNKCALGNAEKTKQANFLQKNTPLQPMMVKSRNKSLPNRSLRTFCHNSFMADCDRKLSTLQLRLAQLKPPTLEDRLQEARGRIPLRYTTIPDKESSCTTKRVRFADFDDERD